MTIATRAGVGAATGATAVLSVRGLSIDYNTRRGPVTAVRDVSFELERGETLAIIGESGSGKTTMAVSLIRLSPRSAVVRAGELLYTKDGITVDIRKFEDDELREFRWSECAMVFQAALNSFNPVINIWEQFADTAKAHGMKDMRAVRARADELLDLVHLDPDRVLRAYPHELSGGMKQRVLIAMSLLLQPQILVLDEPTTALDILTQRAILDLLRELRKKLGFAMIFISHDLTIAAELADRMITMYAGRIVERASVAALFAEPQHPYTIGLLGSIPRLHLDQQRLAAIEGQVPGPESNVQGCRFHPRCPFAIERCRRDDPPLVELAPGHAAACWRAPLDERDA